MSMLSASAVILISFLLLIQMVPGASSVGHVSNDLYIAEMDLIQVSYDSPTIIKNKPVTLPLLVINTFQESMYTDFRINARYNDHIADRPRDRLILLFPLPEESCLGECRLVARPSLITTQDSNDDRKPDLLRASSSDDNELMKVPYEKSESLIISLDNEKIYPARVQGGK